MEFELALQLVMIRVRLLTFRESLVFMFKVKMCFMHEGIELGNSFTSHRWFNIEFLSRTGNEIDYSNLS